VFQRKYRDSNTNNLLVEYERGLMILLQIVDWFVANPLQAIAYLSIIIILLVACYIKIYVKIYDPRIHITHYRKGRVLREYPNGGMVVTIPFFDRIEARLNTPEEIDEKNDDF